MIEILVSNSNEEHDLSPKWENTNQQQHILLQFKNRYWPIFVNSFEIALVASWNFSHLFSDHSLLDFRRHINIQLFKGSNLAENWI